MDDVSEKRSSRDVSAEELGRREAWLEAQQLAFQEALKGKALDVTLGVLARTALQQTRGVSRCGFWIVDEARAGLHQVVGLQSEYAARIDGFPIGRNSLACGLAVATGKPIITSDVREDARWADWLWLAEEFGYRGVGRSPSKATTKMQSVHLRVTFQSHPPHGARFCVGKCDDQSGCNYHCAPSRWTRARH